MQISKKITLSVCGTQGDAFTCGEPPHLGPSAAIRISGAIQFQCSVCY